MGSSEPERYPRFGLWILLAASAFWAFRNAFFLLDRRIALFLSLPLAAMDNLILKKELGKVGRIGDFWLA